MPDLPRKACLSYDMETSPMNFRFTLVLLGAGLAVSACSSSRTASNLDASSPQSLNVQTNNPLALPPDNSLPQPGTGARVADPDAIAAAPIEGDSLAAPAPVAAAKPRDVFLEYGISKTNPDGSLKSNDQLQKELKAAILKRKQQQNPNYGTIKNMGSIFSDG